MRPAGDIPAKEEVLLVDLQWLVVCSAVTAAVALNSKVAEVPSSLSNEKRLIAINKALVASPVGVDFFNLDRAGNPETL